MKFLNNYPRFNEFLTDEYQFYIKGKTNVDYASILSILRDGKFPNNLKGTFAFYFSDKNRIVVAVDHLPNYEMFYSEYFCGHIFIAVQEEIRKKEIPLTVDNLVVDQIGIFWGSSIGEDTTVKEIKRVPPGCYLEITPDKKNKIIQYNNIYSHPKKDFTIEELSYIIEDFIKENTQGPFGLLYSSGTDSNTLLGYFRKLGISDRCSLISIKSTQEYFSEASYTQKIADYYGMPIDWHCVEDGESKKFINIDDIGYKSAYHRTYSGFQTETHILLKYQAIRELGHKNKTIFTGELGDHIFGAKPSKILLKYAIQTPNYDPEQLAELFLNCDLYRFDHIGTKIKEFSSLFYLPTTSSAYDYAKEWFIKTWNKIEVEDFSTKAKLIQYFFQASHRIYNYNQFYDLKFAHPFADGVVFDYIWRMPENYKLIDVGGTRNLSYNLVKDFMVDWPWKLPKTGLTVIPDRIKFENYKGAYDAVQLALGKLNH